MDVATAPMSLSRGVLGWCMVAMAPPGAMPMTLDGSPPAETLRPSSAWPGNQHTRRPQGLLHMSGSHGRPRPWHE